MSNFFFSHSFFKRLVLQTRKNQGLFGERVKYEIKHLILNSLPNDKILNWSKLKVFADDKINGTKELKLVLRPEETLWKKEKMRMVTSIFLLLPQFFQKPASHTVVKSQDCVVKSQPIHWI